MSMEGGSIRSHPILEKILSIGFELETTNMSPCYVSGHTIKFHGNTWSMDINQTRGTDTTQIGLDVAFTPLENYIFQHKEQPIELLDKDHTYTLDTSRFNTRLVQNIYHTEFWFTYYDPVPSNNVLLEHIDLVMNEVLSYYKTAKITSLTLKDQSVISPQQNLYLVESNYNGLDSFIAISNTPPDSFSIKNDIPWHVQCTIGVDLEDLIDVVKYISRGTGYNFSRVMEINRKLFESRSNKRANFTNLEYNLGFLLSMYVMQKIDGLHKDIVGNNDFELTIRHEYDEVYKYHYDDVSDSNHEIFDGNYNIVFPGVSRFEYMGVVLVELRNCYDQLIFDGFGKRELEFPEGMSIQQLKQAITNIHMKTT